MRKEIQIELKSLVDQINSYHDRFGENDIRSSYLDGYFQILRTYFCAYYHLDDFDIIAKYREIYQKDDIKRNDLTVHLQGHKNLLNSFLIINCWSNFELFISLFCNAILSENKRRDLLEIDYQRIRKILQEIPIDDTTDKKLKNFIRSHIAHAPIVYKYGKLLKLIRSYPTDRIKRDDREFLEFFGRLRNCIHSNYIFYGDEKREFGYNDETFIFSPGELISHEPSEEISIYLLTQNLKDIFQVIAENIDYNGEIFDPSFELITS